MVDYCEIKRRIALQAQLATEAQQLDITHDLMCSAILNESAKVYLVVDHEDSMRRIDIIGRRARRAALRKSVREYRTQRNSLLLSIAVLDVTQLLGEQHG